MTIKKQLDKLLNFFSGQKSKLLSLTKTPSIDIMVLYQGEAIGIIQSLVFELDGTLWISRARFDKEKTAGLFRPDSSQLMPFDIVMRFKESANDECPIGITLQGITIAKAEHMYITGEWVLGEGIQLNLPTKVVLNDE